MFLQKFVRRENGRNSVFLFLVKIDVMIKYLVKLFPLSPLFSPPPYIKMYIKMTST